MNFATDRDLLVYEPTLFQDVPWASQQRLQVNDAQTSGTTLTSATADFEGADVGVGHVVLLEQVPYEVVNRVSATELTVSQLRAELSHDPIAPSTGNDQAASVRTFEPQITIVHDQLLHMLGLEPDNAAAKVTEQAIVSVSAMARLEALAALERIFSGAVALTGDNTGLQRKAQAYNQQFHRAINRAVILFDADDDGRVDERRRFAAPRLVRV
jgi:hypothetical protein